MEKEFKIKRDIERTRKSFYDFLNLWMCEDRFAFMYSTDYQWFVENVVKKGEPIFNFDYHFVDDEQKSTLIVYFSYLEKNQLHIHNFMLIKLKNEFVFPKFEKESKGE